MTWTAGKVSNNLTDVNCETAMVAMYNITAGDTEEKEARVTSTSTSTSTTLFFSEPHG